MARLAVMEPTGPQRRAPAAVRALRPHYSRFVGLMKVILPAVAAALLGLLVVWPRLAPSHNDRLQAGMARGDGTRIDTSSIRNPRYYGTDEKNLPFTVTADTATQVDPQNLVVTLERPVADLDRGDGTGIVVNAETGFYRQKDDTLDLMGHVDFFRDDGYELHTESARIAMASGGATGDQPVHGQGPAGTVEGEGFSMVDRGRTIVFTGHSKAVLTVAARKSGS